MMDRENTLLRGLDVITAIFLVIGGLTMGVGGLIGFERVVTFLDSFGMLSRVVSIFIGLSAIYEVGMWRSITRRWCSILTDTPTPHSAMSS